MTPEEIEIEKLYLSMQENPELAQTLYGVVGKALRDIYEELSNCITEETTVDDIMLALVLLSERFETISEI